MQTETFLLKSIACTTIDQLTTLLADYLNQAVLIIDEYDAIISQGQSEVAQVSATWLVSRQDQSLPHHNHAEFSRHVVNPQALNRWYLFVSQSQEHPLDVSQIQLGIRVINHFIDRYALNPNQSEVNSIFAKLLVHPTTNVNLLHPLVTGPVVMVTTTPQTSNQPQFVAAVQDLVAPLPLAEDNHQGLSFLLHATDLPTIRPQLTELGQQFEQTFFISEAFTDIAKSQEFRQICRQAEQIAHDLGSTDVVNSTQKYNIYIILFQVKNTTLLRNTMCTQLIFLKKYDSAHHTELFETLHAFLENNSHIGTTADKLHLHRNSLSKRLAKIQDLIEIDFNNPDKTFGLRLSYRLFKFLQI